MLYCLAMDSMPPKQQTLSVSELNNMAKGILEEVFPEVLVEGEISNLASPASGHMYFSLKDSKASIRCALFRTYSRKLACAPEDGMKVQVAGKLSVYTPRGDYQLIAHAVYAAGAGDLHQRYEQLKRKLHREGVFEQSRQVPPMAQTIGVITSPHGAAIRDVLSVLARRCPSINVVLYPSPVQGAEAVSGIAQMLQLAAERNECDLLLLVRGGGSMEDMQAFNEEQVVRAVAACPIPTISGVGHEVDFCLTDFAADHRAATPSAAAERASPDQLQLRQLLHGYQQRLLSRVRFIVEDGRQNTAKLIARLKTPELMLEAMRQRVDELEQRLLTTIKTKLYHYRGLLQQSERSLRRPDINGRRNMLDIRIRRTSAAFWQLQNLRSSRLASLQRTLQAVNPHKVLERGFAIALLQGKAVESAASLEPGDKLQLLLRQGEADCTVDNVRQTETEPPQEQKDC